MLTFKNISFLSGIALGGVLVAAFFFEISSIWAFVILLFWLGFLVWGTSTIQSGFFVKAYCGGPGSSNKIAITFDDGPHPMTLPVLELLKKHQVKATFFCIGKQIEKHPEIFQKTIENGHTVGNHSYSHSNYFGFFSSKKVKNELDKTDALIKKYTGKKPELFRPPFGLTNLHIKKALDRTKHHTIGWNIRSFDTAIQSEEKILNRIKKRLQPGCIILLHDTSQKSVNVLEQLLIYINNENYEMVSVDQLLNLK
jgi:peptidoglycan/xylan/chitin deacetylase (PgdA/CDA1 family)